MVRGAATGRAVVQATGVLFHMLQKCLEIGSFHLLGVDHHHLRHIGHQDKRHQVALEVVVQPGVHEGRDGVVHSAHEQVVAIGRGLGRHPGAQRATGAAPVVDHHLPAGQPRKLG